MCVCVCENTRIHSLGEPRLSQVLPAALSEQHDSQLLWRTYLFHPYDSSRTVLSHGHTNAFIQ